MSVNFSGQVVLESLVSALLFAFVFVPRKRNSFPGTSRIEAGSLASLGAGLSSAYVFVHVLPALAAVRASFVEATSVSLYFEGRGLYLLALLGFLGFYSLDRVGLRLGGAAGGRQVRLGLWLNVLGFAAYVWLLSYLLLHHVGAGSSSIVLFAVAIALHLVGVNHGLQHRFGTTYGRAARFVIASMCLIGWAMGLFVTLPQDILALVVAFVAGAVIMNSAIMELPRDDEVRILPFLGGGVTYGVILLWLH